MAEVAEGGGGGGGKHEKKRAKKGSTRVDMTPMVDLAFLLLTFFVMTSQFSKPKVMSLVYPAKKPVNEPSAKQEINNAYTFLLSEDRLFYYSGPFKKGETQLTETDFGPKGVRKLLTDGNAYVIQEHARLNKQFAAGKINEAQLKEQLIEAQKQNAALKALIKTDTKATSKNFIDLIDELKLADIGVIAPVDLTKSEEELLNEKLK